MTESLVGERNRRTLRIRGEEIPVWPKDQKIISIKDSLVLMTRFADPRMPVCCQDQPERMTTPLVADMQPGTLVMFPSEIMHFVTPYTGKSPRITLAWNIDCQKIIGHEIPGGLPEY